MSASRNPGVLAIQLECGVGGAARIAMGEQQPRPGQSEILLHDRVGVAGRRQAGHHGLELLEGALALEARKHGGCRGDRSVAAGACGVACDTERLGGVGLGTLDSSRAVPRPGALGEEDADGRAVAVVARRADEPVEDREGLVVALQQREYEGGHRPADARAHYGLVVAVLLDAERLMDQLGGAARVGLLGHRDEGVRDQGEALEVGPRRAGRHRHMLEEVTESRAHAGALEPCGQQRLEQRLRGVRLLVHVGQSALEHIRRLAHASAHEVQHGRPVESVQPGRPARGGRALEVFPGVRVAGVRGREAELEQDLGQHAVIGALEHRSLQVAHRGRGIAEGLGSAGGVPQRGHRPVALARLAEQQVCGHCHGVGLAVPQHLSGLLVRARALNGGHVVLDRRARGSSGGRPRLGSYCCRRVDARTALKAALETFEGLRADRRQFAHRAELRATGETVASHGRVPATL